MRSRPPINRAGRTALFVEAGAGGLGARDTWRLRPGL